MKILKKEIINKGWSNDKKYCITDEENNKYLLRISSLDQYDKKLSEFNYMKQLSSLKVNMCMPIEFGCCDEGVYSIHTRIS